jgi:hypothetical protein
LPGVVLQAGEERVVAGIAEIEGNLVDPEEQLVPLRSALHLDVGEARIAEKASSNAAAVGSAVPPSSGRSS